MWLWSWVSVLGCLMSLIWNIELTKLDIVFRQVALAFGRLSSTSCLAKSLQPTASCLQHSSLRELTLSQFAGADTPPAFGVRIRTN